MAVSHSSIDQNSELPIVSSQNLGWESLVVEEYQQPSGSMELQAEVDPVIVLSLTTHPHRIYQQMDDRRHIGLYRPGYIVRAIFALLRLAFPVAIIRKATTTTCMCKFPQCFYNRLHRKPLN